MQKDIFAHKITYSFYVESEVIIRIKPFIWWREIKKRSYCSVSEWLFYWNGGECSGCTVIP